MGKASFFFGMKLKIKRMDTCVSILLYDLIYKFFILRYRKRIFEVHAPCGRVWFSCKTHCVR